MPFKRPTTTPVPDELFDELLPDLTLAEVRVLLYVIRRTLGFRKDADTISIDQMCRGIVTHEGHQLDRGTGLGRTAVTDALRSLKLRGLIEARQQYNEDGVSRPSLYALAFEGPPARTVGSANSGNQGPPARTLRVQPDGPTTNSRSTNRATGGRTSEKYSRGRYAVCSTCLQRPCACS